MIYLECQVHGSACAQALGFANIDQCLLREDLLIWLNYFLVTAIVVHEDIV